MSQSQKTFDPGTDRPLIEIREEILKDIRTRTLSPAKMRAVSETVDSALWALAHAGQKDRDALKRYARFKADELLSR